MKELEHDIALVYIGESDNVHERLPIHGVEKEFWREVVFFTNKNKHSTKAHIRYLECRLVQQANAVGILISLASNGQAPWKDQTGRTIAQSEARGTT